jgi:hypothetical protein
MPVRSQTSRAMSGRQRTSAASATGTTKGPGRYMACPSRTWTETDGASRSGLYARERAGGPVTACTISGPALTSGIACHGAAGFRPRVAVDLPMRRSSAPDARHTGERWNRLKLHSRPRLIGGHGDIADPHRKARWRSQKRPILRRGEFSAPSACRRVQNSCQQSKSHLRVLDGL